MVCLVLEFLEFPELRQSQKQLCSGIFFICGPLSVFGAEPLQNVRKTTTKGRSPGGVAYIRIYVFPGLARHFPHMSKGAPLRSGGGRGPPGRSS